MPKNKPEESDYDPAEETDKEEYEEGGGAVIGNLDVDMREDIMPTPGRVKRKRREVVVGEDENIYEEAEKIYEEANNIRGNKYENISDVVVERFDALNQWLEDNPTQYKKIKLLHKNVWDTKRFQDLEGLTQAIDLLDERQEKVNDQEVTVKLTPEEAKAYRNLIRQDMHNVWLETDSIATWVKSAHDMYALIEQFAGVTRKVIEKGQPVAQREVKPKPKKKPPIVRDLAYYRTLNPDQLRLEV
ncbi:MAG: hypothetical protein VX289_05440, partial [Candidatus Poribacteria bacterium]|nr:hypothetical protein [Candidatus Poribacteria bacterium]